MRRWIQRFVSCGLPAGRARNEATAEEYPPPFAAHEETILAELNVMATLFTMGPHGKAIYQVNLFRSGKGGLSSPKHACFPFHEECSIKELDNPSPLFHLQNAASRQYYGDLIQGQQVTEPNMSLDRLLTELLALQNDVLKEVKGRLREGEEVELTHMPTMDGCTGAFSNKPHF